MCDLKFLRLEIIRVSLTQEMQEILGCGDPLQVRKVQLLVPQTPQVYLGVDIAPEDIGMNKTFNQPPVYFGNYMQFPVGPMQKLYAATGIGVATCTMIIEHYLDGGAA